jgi:hypothetical protein
MNCDCEGSDKKKKFSILKGKGNLLNLIRGISKEESEQVIKTETLPEELPTQTDTFEQNTELEGSENIEDEIEIKRLKHILDNIERLRYNADNPQKLELSNF